MRGYNPLNEPMMGDLIEATREKVYRVSVPLPSSIALEDTETIRDYVETMIRQRIEEWFDEE